MTCKYKINIPLGRCTNIRNICQFGLQEVSPDLRHERGGSGGKDSLVGKPGQKSAIIIVSTLFYIFLVPLESCQYK